MCPTPYYEMIQASDKTTYLRLKLVQFAQTHGKKPAARAFAVSVPTVRRWCARYDGTLASLHDHSRRPHTSPARIAPEMEARILRLKKRLHTWGAERLRRDYQLPCSAKAILRVFRAHGWGRRPRRKHQRKRDLRAVKAQWRLFQQLEVDTKDLSDLPEYYWALQHRGLPRYQYTAREVVSGLTFLAYAQELALVHSVNFITRLLEHLRRSGVDLAGVAVQTDNGSEFIGSWNARHDSAFTQAVQTAGAAHHTIPPGAKTWQADVETVHYTVERELFELEKFHSRPDFLAATAAWQYFYNLQRKNYSKAGRTPWDIATTRQPNLSTKLPMLRPVFLEELLPPAPRSPLATQRGTHLPSHPFPPAIFCADKRPCYPIRHYGKMMIPATPDKPE